MYRLWLLLPLCLMCALKASAETVMLDAMDTAQAAWGPARADNTQVKQGTGALRWRPDEGPLRRDDLRVDLAKYRSLRLWVYCPEATFARFRLEVPVPEATPFSLTFKADWQGWNQLVLFDELFSGGGTDRAAAWSRARGLALTQIAPGFEPTELVLDGLEISTDYPQMPINDHEVLIDWPYYSSRQLGLWQPTAETLQRPAGSYGFDRYWCWSWLWATEDPARREVCAYTRTVEADLTGYSTLEVRISNDNQSFASVHIQVDGKWSTPLAYVKGTSQFQELQVPLPPGGKRLNRVTLDISEPPDQIGGSKGRQLKCNLQWLALRKAGTPVGEPPVGMQKIEPIPLSGKLEEVGLPGGVYFGREDLPAIRKLFTEGAATSVWASVQKRADEMLDGEPETYAGRWLPQAGWVSKRAGDKTYPLAANARTCALAYVITGDKKYADFARRCLLTLANIDQWSDGFFARYPLGWGGLGNTFVEAKVVYDAGLAYDWIHNVLSPEERKVVAEAILHKGIWWVYNLLQNNPGILKMNQGVVFDSQMGCALLALEPDRPELVKMREQSTEWLWQGLAEYSFNDGASNEGIGYWHYTWGNAVRLLAALGKRDPEGVYRQTPENVKRAMDWIVHMKSNNTADSFRGIFHCDGGGGAPSPSVSAFFAKYLKDPTGAWFQQQHGGPRDEVAAFMWVHDTKAKTPLMVPARHFRDAGMIFLREGFNFGDMCFMLLGSPQLPGHNQRDRTSFMIEAFGEHLAMDPGMISYANPIHTSLANTRLHNAMTIDGKEGAMSSKVTGFFSSPLLDYAAVDGTGAYTQSKRYLRRALYLRPDHFVILDDMELKVPGRIEWNLNSAGELSLQGSRVVAKARKASLVCDFAGADNLKMEMELWPCGYPGVQNHHGTIFSGEHSASASYQVSLYPVRPGQDGQVAVQPLVGPGMKGLAIKFGEQEDRVYQRVGTGALKGEGLEADAEIAVVRLVKGRLTGAAIIGGTGLQWQGQALLKATKAGNYAVEYREGDWLTAGVQAEAGTEVTLQPPAGQAWREVLIGSVAGDFRPSDSFELDKATFTVPEKAPPAGWWLVGNKPKWLDLAQKAPVQLNQLLVDGQPFKTGGVLPEGVVPKTLELRLKPGENPLALDELQVFFNNRLLAREQWQAAEKDGLVTVTLQVEKLLKPEERQPELYTTHTLEVQCRDRGLMRWRGQGRLQFTLRPVSKQDVVYLSNVEPVSCYVHGGLKRDRAFFRSITLAGVVYPKGLTTHPKADGGYAEVIYDLRPYKGKRQTFRALVGIPEDTPGSVQFIVYTRTGGGEWVERLKTEVLGSTSAPVNLVLPLGEAEELRLYVNDGGNGIGSDHAAWALARLE